MGREDNQEQPRTAHVKTTYINETIARLHIEVDDPCEICCFENAERRTSNTSGESDCISTGSTMQYKLVPAPRHDCNYRAGNG